MCKSWKDVDGEKYMFWQSKIRTLRVRISKENFIEFSDGSICAKMQQNIIKKNEKQ